VEVSRFISSFNIKHMKHMKKQNLLVPVTLGITQEQFLAWVTIMTHQFGAKNTNHNPEANQSFFIICGEVTEEDIKFAERTLSNLCEKSCDVMCIRGTEEAWDKVTDGDLLILNL
jgi:uncharacterized membrane protein YukC